MRELYKDTADEIRVFMSDSTDHVTPVTGATVAVTLLKKGQTSFASGGGTVTEAGNGWYIYYATTTDTNTYGPLAVRAVATGADDFNTEFQVKHDNPYAQKVVEVDTFDGSLDLNSTMKASVNTQADTAISDANLALEATAQTILADTNELQTNQGNWLTADGFSTLTAQQVWEYATRVLSSTGVTAIQSGLSTSEMLEIVKAVTDKLNDMLELDSTVYRFTENALEQAPSGGGSLTAEEIADEVDSVLTISHGPGPWTSGGMGSGSISKEVTITDGTNPLDGVNVWVTTDEAGTNTIASGYTDSLGKVTFMLDAGSYYTWMQLAGYNFTNPQTLEVS